MIAKNLPIVNAQALMLVLVVIILFGEDFFELRPDFFGYDYKSTFDDIGNAA
jgi:hypothetical protein